MLGRQIAFTKDLSAIGTGATVAAKQLGLGDAWSHIEQVSARHSARRDAGGVVKADLKGRCGQYVSDHLKCRANARAGKCQGAVQQFIETARLAWLGYNHKRQLMAWARPQADASK